VQGSGLPQPYAVVVLSESARKTVDSEAGKEEIKKALLDHLERVNAELDQHEQLELIAVTKDPWTIENGTLTPTLKVKRTVVDDKYGKKAESWYEKKEKIVWV
jgi:long-subunit acyl-CoA synthetase (AMP-forming)